MSANDTQVGGTHYKKLDIQPWDAMKVWMSKEAFHGFLQGNVIKYIARYKDKNGLEDLKKARHYLDKLIEEMTVDEFNKTFERVHGRKPNKEVND